MTDAERQSLDGLIDEVTRLLRGIELVGSSRVVAWAEESGLSLEDVSVLLALAAHDGAAAGAVEIAELSGLSLDAAYRGLHRLCAGGFSREEHRRYALMETGERSVAAVDDARRAGVRAYLLDLPDDERLLLESSLRSPREVTGVGSA